MKPIRKFEEFLKERIVKQQSIDKSRAEFLIKEAETSYDFLREKIKVMGVSDKNANRFSES